MSGGKRPSKKSLGYTIIEVMIVLGVSGLMFVMASTFISGKQQRTAFTAGANELASVIQDTIDGVSDGQYSDIPLSCNTAGAKTTAAFTTGNQVGQQSNCMFLGKVLHFNVAGTTSPKSSYETFSLIGQRAISGKQITSLVDAKLGAADPLTTQNSIPQSLEIGGLIDVTTPGVGSGGDAGYGIGFMQSLPSNNALGSGLKTSAQAVGLYYVNGPRTSQDSAAFAADISSTSVQPAASAKLCLTDGDRSAYITIGGDAAGSASKLSVEVKMLGRSAC